MFSLVWQLPVGKRAPAYGRYGTFCSLHRCLPLSPRLPPPAPSFPSFYLPHLRLKKKAKAHIAREQLVSAISNHQCTSQSPLIFAAYLPSFPSIELTQNRCGRSPGTPTLKAPRSLFYILSLVLHPLSPPSSRPLSRSLIYHFHQFFFWYRLTRVFLLLACFIVDSFFTLTETSLHSVTFWLAVSLFWLCFFFFFLLLNIYICRCCEAGGPFFMFD